MKRIKVMLRLPEAVFEAEKVRAELAGMTLAEWLGKKIEAPRQHRRIHAGEDCKRGVGNPGRRQNALTRGVRDQEDLYHSGETERNVPSGTIRRGMGGNEVFDSVHVSTGQDSPPVGQSRIEETMTAEEFYALPLAGQMQAIRDGKF